jgi:hypothetical protein
MDFFILIKKRFWAASGDLGFWNNFFLNKEFFLNPWLGQCDLFRDCENHAKRGLRARIQGFCQGRQVRHRRAKQGLAQYSAGVPGGQKRPP